MSNDSFEPPVAIAVYRIYLSFIPLLHSFPKLYRYSLCLAIQTDILALLELILEANSLPRPLREAPLVKAASKCEALKLLTRMSFELKILESARYFQLSSDICEIGKMLGGWIKFVRSGPYARNRFGM